MDWNDLKFFLAVAHGKSLTAAAGQLGVSPSTVSRRIEVLERALNARLFRPHRDGYDLTQTGLDLVPAAERASAQIRVFERSAHNKDNDMSGPVRIEAPELLGKDVLLPALAKLIDTFPSIKIELRSSVRSVRSVRLVGEEADIIFRLVRPDRGSYRIRRLGQIPFGLYASSGYIANHGKPHDPHDLNRHKVIGWSEDLHYLKMATWLESLCPGLQPALRLSTLSAQLAAARHGLGWAVLPAFAADPAALVPALTDVAQLSPDLWLLLHEQSAALPRVKLVSGVLVKALA